MKTIQKATFKARERTGRNIGTCVKQGKWKVVIVDYRKDGRSDITDLSGPIEGYEVIGFLNAL